MLWTLSSPLKTQQREEREKGVSRVEQRYIKESLEKQLQLISERSKENDSDLVGLTKAMCEVVSQLLSFSSVE